MTIADKKHMLCRRPVQLELHLPARRRPAFVGWMVVQDGLGTQQWKWGQGYVDAIICWGAGLSELEALQDSLQWISSSEGFTHIETTDHIQEDGRFVLRPCTRAAIAHLKEYGSDFDFVIVEGRVLIKSEDWRQ